MEGQWQLLQIGHRSRQLPSLFIKYQSGLSTYTVLLTDLTYIWKEALSRKQIIKRAFELDTSIDPSEGFDQLTLLLQYLQSALDGRAATSRKLSSGQEERSLILELGITLPVPLLPLCWHLHLSPADPDVLRTELLLPCLKTSSQGRSEVLSLCSILKEKDYVITRLIDKLQASGLELTAVFPSLVPTRTSKANAREVLMRSVRGLQPFHENNWREQFSSNIAENLDEWDHGLPYACLPLKSFSVPQSYGVWWANATPDGDTFIADSSSSNTERARSTYVDGRATDRDLPRPTIPEKADDNDGKRSNSEQGRPVGTEAISSRLPLKSASSTTSASDDDAETSVIPEPVVQVYSNTSPKESKNAGIIGRRTSFGSSPESTCSSPPTHRVSTTSLQGSTEGYNLVHRPTVARGRLGVIGGPKKLTRPAASNDEGPRDLAAQDTKVLGRNMSHDHIVDNDGSKEVGGPEEVALIKPVVRRETSKERADRKREELKRELDHRAPVRKKRRF